MKQFYILLILCYFQVIFGQDMMHDDVQKMMQEERSKVNLQIERLEEERRKLMEESEQLVRAATRDAEAEWERVEGVRERAYAEADKAYDDSSRNWDHDERLEEIERTARDSME